jgi:putative effector of murein hydrolase LrgA (UPF0299 family)
MLLAACILSILLLYTLGIVTFMLSTMWLTDKIYQWMELDE